MPHVTISVRLVVFWLSVLLSVSLTLPFRRWQNSPFASIIHVWVGVGRATTNCDKQWTVCCRWYPYTCTTLFCVGQKQVKMLWCRVILLVSCFFLFRDESYPGVIWCQIFGISEPILIQWYLRLLPWCRALWSPLQSVLGSCVSRSGARIHTLSSIEMSQTHCAWEALQHATIQIVPKKKHTHTHNNKCFAFVFIFMSFAFQTSTSSVQMLLFI